MPEANSPLPKCRIEMPVVIMSGNEAIINEAYFAPSLIEFESTREYSTGISVSLSDKRREAVV